MENKKPSIDKIILHIEKTIGRKLSHDERKSTGKKISNVDYSSLSKPLANSMVDKIIALIIKSLRSDTKDNFVNKVVDVKEFQIRQQKNIDATESINSENTSETNIPSGNSFEISTTPLSLVPTSATSIFNTDDPRKLQLLINPKSLYKSEYIVLDSKNRDFVPTEPTLMKWRYNASGQYTQGVVTTVDKLRDIVGMRMSTVSTRNTYRYLFSCPLYTLLIQEFAAQSFIAHEARRFHFAMRPTFDTRQGTDVISSLYSVLKPLNNGYYWFEKPITEVNSFTVSIGNPLIPIILPIENIVVPSSVFSVSNPVTIDISSHPAVPVGTFSFYAVGDLVRITGFNTANPIADAVVISLINDPAGHFITATSGAAGSSITINVDTSTITPLTDNSNPTIIIDESVRIMIPLEIIYIESASD